MTKNITLIYLLILSLSIFSQNKNNLSKSDSLRLNSNPITYKQGITEEIIENKNFKQIKRTVVRGEEVKVYIKKSFSWGGAAFFRDGKEISEAEFELETSELDDKNVNDKEKQIMLKYQQEKEQLSLQIAQAFKKVVETEIKNNELEKKIAIEAKQKEIFLVKAINEQKKKENAMLKTQQISDSLEIKTKEIEIVKQKIENEKKNNELISTKNEKTLNELEIKRQNIIIGSVSIVLLLVAVFSILLYNRFKTTQKQKQIIEVKEKETQAQKHIIEEKQKEILDSINYAKRIQYTLLAHDEFLKENLPEHFTYFNPKDIVSGDFYWATKHNNKFYLAVCDSTGHGVPGAFMSLLNIGFLSEAINEKGIEKPNEIFDYVRLKLTNTISKEGQKDGFDGILLCFDISPLERGIRGVSYAAANNAPILIQNNQLTELNADRMPVGVGERKENFTLHTLEVNKGDVLYLYTDGYADQFGGPKGKKFKYKQLNELILALHSKPLSEQHTELKSAFENWKGNLEQVDDVCVIGIRI